MELFGRRWDRWDAIVAAAAMILIVVSSQPWYRLQDEGSVTIWNAWTHWQLSGAVALGMLAAGVQLAYRGRPEAQGATWMAVFMLLSGLGLVGWHWQHADAPEMKAIVTFRDSDRSETPEQRGRRFDEELAALVANPPPLPTRSAPQWAFYAGAGSLIVMGAAIARSRPSRADAG